MSKKVGREILGMSKVTYKYQVTIPKRVRESFNINIGETLIFFKEDERLLILRSIQY